MPDWPYRPRCYHPTPAQVLGMMRAWRGSVLGRGPTVRDLARAINCRASDLGPVLLALEFEGLIQRGEQHDWVVA